MVTLGNLKRVDGVTTVLKGPETFTVEPLLDGALPRKSFEEVDEFREAAFAFQQDLTATTIEKSTSQQTVDVMLRVFINKATSPSDNF